MCLAARRDLDLENSRFDKEGSIELDYFWGDCAMENVEFHDDPVQLSLIELKADLLWPKSARLQFGAQNAHLHSHCNLGWLVQHLLHSAVVTLSQLLVELQLIHIDAEGRAVREVDALGVQHGLPVEVECA